MKKHDFTLLILFKPTNQVPTYDYKRWIFGYVTFMGGLKNPLPLQNLILSCINTRLALIQDQDQD